jgi:phenylacetate-coenzyme A ligase PaaK-like adenylate-forming protein
MGTETTLGLMEKIRPEVLIGMPTFLYHVLRQAAGERRSMPQVRRLVLGGEKAPEGLRRKLRTLCAELGAGDVSVLATYGFTEAKMAWIECPPPPGAEVSGYHTVPGLSLIEVIDPATGEPVGEREPGEIVFTALDSRGTVVIRYRTGDRISGGLDSTPCPHCGRAVPRLVGSISRVSEIRQLDLAKLKGTLVDFNTLEHALDDLDDLGPWQLELRKHNDDPFECDELVVHASRGGTTGAEELEAAIRQRFVELTELRPNRILWHTPEEVRDRHGVGRALKEEKIIDSRPPVPGSDRPRPGVAASDAPTR